ncbi:hypothetical protein GQ457_09G018780 [Hibiscus cannabinus]
MVNEQRFWEDQQQKYREDSVHISVAKSLSCCDRLPYKFKPFVGVYKKESIQEFVLLAVSIKASLRALRDRNELWFRKQTVAAIIIQSQCRRKLAYICYHGLKEATFIIHCAVRASIACEELMKLRRVKLEQQVKELAMKGAKETAALLETNERLEQQVKELIMKAAKETGALQETKEKLEPQVNELTMKAAKETGAQQETMEKLQQQESKSQEISRLQSTLEKTLLELQQKNEVENKEPQTAKNIAEQVLATQVSVTTDESMNKATAENEGLKLEFQETKELPIKESEAASSTGEQVPVSQEVPALVSSLEQTIDETKNKYEESSKQAMEAESKIIELKTTMQRLEEKILDIETDDQILQQQPLLSVSNAKMLEPTAESSPQENDQQEHVDTRIKCVSQNLGFSQEKPVAAFTIYKCLLHWKSFEAEKRSVFDLLIGFIGSALEVFIAKSSDILQSLKSFLKSSVPSEEKPEATSMFSRITQSFHSSSVNLPIGVVQLVEANYPALLFKQQLRACVEKIFGIIRDNLKKDLSQHISCCIQVLMTSKEASKTSEESKHDTSPAVHWQNIIECLNHMLSTLKGNFIISAIYKLRCYDTTFFSIESAPHLAMGNM